jgi:aerobic carbon-monoxide dehydrogenase medium subunit
MKPFELAEPKTLSEAIALLDPADSSVRALAGGTALMLMMKARVFQPTRLVSLHRLNGSLRGVRQNADGSLSIGALTSLRDLERSPVVATSTPVIAHALKTLANVRVRNVATIGGHLAHGDPHMDLPPILLTMQARVRAVSSRGERWIDMSEFFAGYYQTALAKDELIAELAIPPQPRDVCTAYAKCTTLSADDWPAVGVAVWYRFQDRLVADARIAISAATERPMRSSAAEAVLAGSPAEPAAFARAAEAAAQEVQPLADIRGSASYKREMVQVFVRRALEQASQSRSGTI